MKKLISMILCLSTAFALSACAELDAIRNTKLPPLPTPEVRATEEPAPVEIESAPEASRETPKPAISALPVDASGAEIGDRVIIYSKKTTENLDAPDGSLLLRYPETAARAAKTICWKRRSTTIRMFTTKGPN